MLSPIFLRGIPQSRGDPGGVELWELAAITEPCLSLPESGLFLDVNSVRHTAIRERVFNNNIDYWSVCDGQMHVLFLQILIFLANLWGNYIFTPAYFALMKFGNSEITVTSRNEGKVGIQLWNTSMMFHHPIFQMGLCWILYGEWRSFLFLGRKSYWIFITE